MKYLFLLLLLLLSGRYGQPLLIDIERPTITVKVTEGEDIQTVCGIHKAGCAIINREGIICNIAVQPPRGLDDTERFAVIGKEFWHCVKGDYHP